MLQDHDVSLNERRIRVAIEQVRTTAWARGHSTGHNGCTLRRQLSPVSPRVTHTLASSIRWTRRKFATAYTTRRPALKQGCVTVKHNSTPAEGVKFEWLQLLSNLNSLPFRCPNTTLLSADSFSPH